MVSNATRERLRNKIAAKQQALLSEAQAILGGSTQAPADRLDHTSNPALHKLAATSFYSHRNHLQRLPLARAEAARVDHLTHVYEASEAASASGMDFCDFLVQQINTGRVPELISWFECHAASAPEPGAYAMLGALHTLRGDSKKANTALAAALAHGGNPCKVYAEAGNTLFRSSRFALAIPLLKAAVAEGPKEIDIHERLAMCLYSETRKEEAQVALDEATKRGALSLRGWVLSGQLASERGEVQKAVACFERALARNPNSITARVAMASACGKTDDAAAQRVHIDAALQLPLRKHCDIETLAGVLLHVISRHPDADDAKRVDQLRDIALVHAPEHAHVWRLLAPSFARVSSLEDMAVACKRLLTLPVESPEASMELADLCRQCDQDALALQALEVGYKGFRQSAGLARKLANALLLLDDRPGLGRVLPLLRLAQQHGNPQDGDGGIITAVVAKLLPDEHAAETLWRMCTFKDAAPEAYMAVATLYNRLSTHKTRAEKALRYVLSQDPEHAAAARQLGELLKRTGRLHEAAALLDPPSTATPSSTCDQRVLAVGRPLAAATSHKPGQSAAPRYRATVLGRSFEGILRGHSCDGSVVLETDDGQVCWSATVQAIAHAPGKAVRAADSVPQHHQSVASSALVAMFDAHLSQAVQGAHSALEYIQELARCGSETFVIGGSVRRLLHACAHGQDPKPTEHDVDLVTSRDPAAMVWITRDVAKDIRGQDGRRGGITSPRSAAWYGVVSYNRLDIASMRVHGMFAEKTKVVGRAAPVFPLAFGPDLQADAKARDFRCNAVYYDPSTQRLYDPTGGGIEDAVHKRIRLVSTDYIASNPTLAMRYCKLRCEGYTTDATTQAHISDNAQTFLRAADMSKRIARLVAQQAKAQSDLAAFVRDTLTSWGDILERDCSINDASKALARHAEQATAACAELLQR